MSASAGLCYKLLRYHSQQSRSESLLSWSSCSSGKVTDGIELRLTLAAAAAAKSLQSCPTLCNPIDGSPPGSPIPRILQARIVEWVAISFSSAWKWKVKVKSLSCIPFLETPWTAAYQSMGFSRQEYWGGVPLPSPQSCRRAGFIQHKCGLSGVTSKDWVPRLCSGYIFFFFFKIVVFFF